MGVAEAIPGVSGGTIAFITGIYQELIETIKSITPSNLKLIFTDFRSFWASINGTFLMTLLIGMLGGIVFGVLVITHFLETEREILWGFFFGLVVASAYVLGRDVSWSVKNILLTMVGAIISYAITMMSPASGSTHFLYIFFAGSIAVSALMLPGVSGSFILLLFGLYHTVMSSLKSIIKVDFDQADLIIVLSMTSGVLVGLFSFARMLSYLFKNYEQKTMAFLIGILIGSLNKLWPWKLIRTAFDKEANQIVSINDIILPDPEQFKVFKEINLMPWTYLDYGDPKQWLVCTASVLGIGLILVMGFLDKSEPI